MGYRNLTLPEGHTWESYTKFLLDTLPTRLRNNYVKKFNTSIQFWHTTGGGLEEEAIEELLSHGYHIQRNGVSNYTLAKNSQVIFLGKIPGPYRRHPKYEGYPQLETDCCCILKKRSCLSFHGVRPDQTAAGKYPPVKAETQSYRRMSMSYESPAYHVIAVPIEK